MRLLRTHVMACALMLCAWSPLVAAENCDEAMRPHLDDQGRPKATYLVQARRCFGDADDADANVVKFNQLLQGDEPVTARAQRALQMVAGTWLGPDSKLDPKAALERARVAAHDTINGVKSAVPPGNSPVSPVDWEWNAAAQLHSVPDLKLDERLQLACAPEKPLAACRQTMMSTNEWLRFSNLMRRALVLYQKDYTDAVKAYADKRVRMWHAYRDDGLPQFPWEYALNSWVMRRTDQRPRVQGNPSGYEAIPTSQLILLHPGAGLEWREDQGAIDDENLKPALYLELFGINRWSYEEDGSMRGGSGISLMLSYTNRDGRESTGYGLMFHSRRTKQFSLGIARAGSDTVFMLNVDLAEYFKTYLPYWNDVQGKIDAAQ